jgi:hypothetical protein
MSNGMKLFFHIISGCPRRISLNTGGENPLKAYVVKSGKIEKKIELSIKFYLTNLNFEGISNR